MHSAVLNFLNSGRWRTATEIQAQTGVTPVAMRRLCQQHPGSYISGPRGYKRADRASQQELTDAIDHLLSRSDKIIQRARVLQRRRQHLNVPGNVVRDFRVVA